MSGGNPARGCILLTMNAGLQSLLPLIIKNKPTITLIFWAIWLSTVIILVGGVSLAFLNHEWLLLLYNLGKKFGEAAMIFYLVGLYPGILKRIELLTSLRVAAALFKRHLGVTMFLFSFNHYMFTTLLTSLVLGGIPTLSPHAVFGFFALIVLFPLWLTSNNWAQMKMGKFWKMLHRLTYVALCLLFMHVALQQSKWLLPVAITLVLEIYSWLVAWKRKSSQNQVVPNA